LPGAAANPRFRSPLQEIGLNPFDGHEVEAALRPAPDSYGFDLSQALSAVVALETRVPGQAYTAAFLGTQRLGNAIVIGRDGLVLTVGYLVTEAEAVTLTLADGRRVPAHVLGVDTHTGLGLVQALEPLGVTPLPLGSARRLEAGSSVIVAGAGGRAHAASGRVVTRMPFAGYWEYLLDEAIITEPAHPHWSGAALIGEGGELVGVGSLSLERELDDGGASAINMFVPAELLAPILDDLARGRQAHPPRPWLGVFAHDIEDHVVIVGISPKGPAARAELRAGDVILGVGGRSVADLTAFYKALWKHEVGDTVRLQVLREEDAFEVDLRAADRGALLWKRPLN
jgi:S1-C subfamily serine protease